MTDYTETVRAMRTSDLLALLIGDIGTSHEKIIDPDGALDAVLRGDADKWRRRMTALLTAIAAELDRRIPIPETP